MRVQRNKQILHELEGGPLEKYYYDEAESFSRSNSHCKSYVKDARGKIPESVIPITGADMEVLGPDFCNKRPVFLAPNQTRMPLNGTLNMTHLAATAYPAAPSNKPGKV
jgi:hypothetical protein